MGKHFSIISLRPRFASYQTYFISSSPERASLLYLNLSSARHAPDEPRLDLSHWAITTTVALNRHVQSPTSSILRGRVKIVLA
ncbi:hypothetical protein ACHAO4_000279 [Trichoderma viride]